MNVLMAFTAQQLARLSQISDRRLRYWEETGVFRPIYVERRERGPFRRIYSFRDLVSLRTLALLRDSYEIQLDELRRASTYLYEHVESPWSELALRVYGSHLAFRDPMTNSWMSASAPGQLVLTLEMSEVSRDAESDARKSMIRTADHQGIITRNRNVMSNAWVVSGTRIPVDAIISLYDDGMTIAQIVDQYPSLVPADIEAAVIHADSRRHAA
jgi:uncharacterized protein (DUF433 family)